MPRPCRAVKGLECVFPIWFAQWGHVWFTLSMPRPCPSSQGHSTARPSRASVWATCSRSASSGYHAEFHEVLIRRITISDASGQCETKHRLSWTRKRVVAAHWKKKDDLLHCWTSSSDISGYHADIHEGHGTVEAGQGGRHGMCELTHGMAVERDATCESALNCTHKLSICKSTMSDGRDKSQHKIRRVDQKTLSSTASVIKGSKDKQGWCHQSVKRGISLRWRNARNYYIEMSDIYTSDGQIIT